MMDQKIHEHAPRFSNYCGYVNLESCELKNVQHHFETERSIPWELFMSSSPAPATRSLFSGLHSFQVEPEAMIRSECGSHDGVNEVISQECAVI